MNSLTEQLLDVQGVASVCTKENVPGAEDLYVVAGRYDVIIWHSLHAGRSLVLLENTRLEGVPDSWIVELVQRIAADQFAIEGLAVRVLLDGQIRTLS
ncbi:MAG: hypothetical protein HGA44_16115 [Cellulomonadaceae bacterium]|nr:hypothetical protein [Cellulomonadaceae bacterium]